jgi:hypothetical protein
MIVIWSFELKKIKTKTKQNKTKTKTNLAIFSRSCSFFMGRKQQKTNEPLQKGLSRMLKGFQVYQFIRKA